MSDKLSNLYSLEIEIDRLKMNQLSDSRNSMDSDLN